MATQAKNVVAPAKLVVTLGKFEGAFGKFQTSAYGDLVRGGIAKPIAHKVAFDYGSDIGTAMKLDGKFASAIGKAKENKSTLKIGATIKNTNNSRTMSVIRAAQQMSDLFDENLFSSRKMPTLSETLVEYLDDCKKWVAEHDFADGGDKFEVTPDMLPAAPVKES